MEDDRPKNAAAAGLAAIVLDDDGFTLRFMEKALGRLGVSDVTCCLAAPEALAAVEAARVAGRSMRVLLVCDLNMPDMDGIEFLRVLAARRFDGPVLILSGADVAVRDAATKLAAAYGLDHIGTFAKPLAPDRLAAIVAKVGARP